MVSGSRKPGVDCSASSVQRRTRGRVVAEQHYIREPCAVSFAGLNGPKAQLDAASDPNAPADLLSTLVDSPYVFVLQAVAGNESTLASDLALLGERVSDDWNGDELLRAIAMHGSTPSDVLARVCERVPPLLHERDRQGAFAAGIAACQHPGTPCTRFARC
jgi:hypothetical protein